MLLPAVVEARDRKDPSCASRAESLVATDEVQLKMVPGWSLTAQNRLGAVTCRATRAPGAGDAMTILHTPNSEYRNGHWYLDLTSRARKLAKAESPATLVADRKPIATGKALEISDSVGGKTVAEYVRAEFPALDPAAVEKLRDAKTIELRAEGMETISVPPLGAVIRALQHCAWKATGPERETFWKNAERICN